LSTSLDELQRIFPAGKLEDMTLWPGVQITALGVGAGVLVVIVLAAIGYGWFSDGQNDE
jgi:hypothetical protein